MSTDPKTEPAEDERCGKSFELYVFESRKKKTCVRVTQGDLTLGPVEVPNFMHNYLMDIASYVEQAHKVGRALKRQLAKEQETPP